MPPQNKPQNAKNHISQQKKKLGDLGICPTSPSYSLTLTFIDSIQLQLSFNAYVPRISEPTELEF